MLALLLFGLLFIVLLIGFPVAFSLAGVSILFGWAVFGLDFFRLIPLRIFGTMSNQLLISVPLFIFMGVMLEKSGIAERLLESMSVLLGKLRGGLALAVILVGAMLAASTGIVGATVVTMGLLSLPTMLKKGYQPELACGTIAASGTLGQIIPPSVVLVLLGSVMNVSVGDLFMGAVLPGMLLIGLYILYVLVLSFFKKDLAPALTQEEIQEYKSEGYGKKLFRAFFLPLLLILGVLGTIFLGIATPTEAAGVGAFMATIFTWIEKKLSLEILRYVMRETLFLTSMVFIILVGATAFGLCFRGIGGDHALVQWLQSAELSPYAFLTMVMIGIFIAGFFIDFIEIVFIFIPVVTPVFAAFHIDLLWVAILVSVNLQTSFLTPPFGFALFYLKGVAPESIRTSQIYKGVLPFVLIQLLLLVLLIAFPELVTMLPRLIYGNK